MEDVPRVAHERLVITLEPKSIATCVDLPSELSFMGQALQHQVDVFEKARDRDIILDSAPTGTGKTQAALSVLLHQPYQNAIYIAPTNALVEQQKQAAEEFIRRAALPHFVIAASAKEVRTWSNDKVGSRRNRHLRRVSFVRCQTTDRVAILSSTLPRLWLFSK